MFLNSIGEKFNISDDEHDQCLKDAGLEQYVGNENKLWLQVNIVDLKVLQKIKNKMFIVFRFAKKAIENGKNDKNLCHFRVSEADHFFDFFPFSLSQAKFYSSPLEGQGWVC